MEIEEAELRDALRPILIDTAQDRDAARAAIAQAGWTGLLAPEAAGGLAQPLDAACWLYAEAGRALSPAPILPALLAGDAIAACPASPGRDDWLARVAGGEPVAASLLDATTLRLDGERLAGTIAGIEGAEGASHLLLAAADPALVALVPLDSVRVAERRGWDETRALADVTLDLPIADLVVLARGADAAPAIERTRAHLHFAIAADCVGAADAILGETVAYLQTRRQFDRPLAMFQALKHRCADLRTRIAAADALLRDKLGEYARGDGVATALAAKSFASTAFRAVAEEAMQLHGGIGMTREHPCHRYLKRALLNEHLASADEACDLGVAAALLGAGG
jgi:alkylation response protein AidB-like acyl-CoA dehydrogenase